MDRPNWQRVQELFRQVADQDPADREAFLARACGDDHALREEVWSLLAHDSAAGEGFLRPEPDDLSAAVRQGFEALAPADALVGQRIGRYQIKSVIAQGGMGTVYAAEQDEPRRIVALKVMHRHLVFHSALHRFRLEAQVLGRLSHPHVAKVFEAGVHGSGVEAVPFFALEFVPGAISLTCFARENKLPLRRRVELFVDVCEAVHHAHQKGIIHRDLKPANILVGSDGAPKVIDFGVARATDSDLTLTSAHTGVGQLIGTMQYMSPEQCDGDPHDIDIRSDVYSLGVVLYELLTEALPYKATGTTIFAATIAIKEAEPCRAALRVPEIRGDLEAVVLKALQKPRENRYQTASDLARDLQRWLNREPIEARPPAAWTRAARWIGRRPVAATAVGGAILTLACASVSVLVALNVTARFRDRPHHIESSPDGRSARLISWSGRDLHVWSVEPSSSSMGGVIPLPQLVKRPAELGGGELAIVAFQSPTDESRDRAVAAFEVGADYERPLWVTPKLTQGDLPATSMRSLSAQEFHPCNVFAADIFPDRAPGQQGPSTAGPEIVVVFAHMFSWRALRIYNLRGELLYAVWHDGAVTPSLWLAEPRLLVCSGTNCEYDWPDRGVAGFEDVKPYPIIVFALRPELGFMSREPLSVEHAEGPLRPIWYKCVMPPSLLSGDSATQVSVPNGRFSGSARHAEVAVTNVNGIPRASAFWIIDEHGEEVPGTRAAGDALRVSPDKRWMTQLHLTDLPPKVASRPASQPAAP